MMHWLHDGTVACGAGGEDAPVPTQSVLDYVGPGAVDCPACLAIAYPEQAARVRVADALRSPGTAQQPDPVPTGERPVWELVIEDMRARDRVGVETYGTPLQVDNGRDHLVDAYQEQLDHVVYLRAEIERRRDRADRTACAEPSDEYDNLDPIDWWRTVLEQEKWCGAPPDDRQAIAASLAAQQWLEGLPPMVARMVGRHALAALADLLLQFRRHQATDPETVRPAVHLIAEERARQIHEEGWTPEHDDRHGGGQLAQAAACYATPPEDRHVQRNGTPSAWPWVDSWWKPGHRVRELIKAGALIVAEIERLGRKGEQ